MMLNKISLVDCHAVEETLRYIETNTDAKYQDLITNLSWYWVEEQQQEKHPREWMIDWIKLLTGEYRYEDFCIRRSHAGSRSIRNAPKPADFIRS